MPETILYHNGSLLTDSDYIDLSDDYALPIDIVKEVVAQIMTGGKPTLEMYSGVIRQKVEEMTGNISTTKQTPEEKSDEEENCDKAAGHMLAAVIDPMDDHFLLQPDGSAVVNQANPPSIEKAYDVVAKALKMDMLTDRVKDFSSWLLGSLVVAGKRHFGEAEFDVGQVCEQTGKSYNTVKTAEDVFLMFEGRRVVGLTFTHHKEVAYPMSKDDDEKFPIDAKIEVLKFAKRRHLSARDTRNVASYWKHHGNIDALTETRTPDQLQKFFKEHREDKTSWLVFDKKSWKRMNLRGSIPKGEVVINLNTYTVRQNNQEETEIPLEKSPTA